MRAPAIGDRSRCFTLELPLESPDGFGGVLRTFQPGPRLWGAMELVSAAERQRADRGEGTVTHRITLPYRDDVTDVTRLTLGLRRFRIRTAADPDGRRRNLVCMVEEMRA